MNKNLTSLFQIIFTIAVLTLMTINATAKNVFHRNLNYKIILPDSPSKTEAFAASELKKFLGMNYSSPIKLETGKSKVIFYVGMSEAAKNAGFTTMLEVNRKHFGVFREKNAFLFRGFDDSNLNPIKNRIGYSGTLLAVYYFLDKYVGIKFFYPGENGYSITKKNKQLVFKNKSDIPKPSFELRGFTFFQNKEFSKDEVNIFFRRLLNCIPRWGEKDYRYCFGRWSKRFTKTHPEYFVEINGKRKFGGHKVGLCFPCTSHSGVAGQIVKDLDIYIKKHPNKKTVQIYCGVPRLLCQCKLCRKHKEKSFYEFQQRIAYGVHKKHPNINFLTYVKPNRDELKWLTKLDSKFTIAMLMNAYSNNTMPRHFLKTLKKSKIRNIIDLTIPHGIDAYPVIRPGYVTKFIKSAKGLTDGMKYSMRWGKKNSCPYSFCALDLFLRSKLLFDVNSSYEKILREFCSLAYPGAENEMAEFYKEMDKICTNLDIPSSNPYLSTYTLKKLKTPIALLQKASKKTKSMHFKNLYDDFKKFYNQAHDQAKKMKENLSKRIKTIDVLSLKKALEINVQPKPETWTDFWKEEFMTPCKYDDFQKTYLFTACDKKTCISVLKPLKKKQIHF